MASSRGADEAQVETTTTSTPTPGMDISQAQPHRTDADADNTGAPSSTPVEMSTLQSQQQQQQQQQGSANPTDTTTPAEPQQTTSQHAPLTRAQTEALGPSTDGPIPLAPSTSDRGPTLSISLMLITGARHPYKIDSKYLRNRNVAVGKRSSQDGSTVDPREVLSGYKLKELIWTDWRTEWEPRPASPSSIRLIIMGRMLDDKALLKDFPFSLETVNVVHMTVKPADLVDDEAEATGKGPGKSSLRGRDGEDGGAGCRCVIL